MIVRPITEADVDRVSAFALRVLEMVACDEPVLLSPAKVHGVVQFFASTSGREHFQRAAFQEDGEVVAAIALYVGEMPFFERSEGHIYFCFSTVVGAGFRLVREMMAWVKTDMRVRRVSWLMNQGDDRLSAVLDRRFGFSRHLDGLVWYK